MRIPNIIRLIISGILASSAHAAAIRSRDISSMILPTWSRSVRISTRRFDKGWKIASLAYGLAAGEHAVAMGVC